MASRGEIQLAQQIELVGLPVPEREYVFARDLGRRWRFDFCWPDRLLAVEVNGAVFKRYSRHQHGKWAWNDWRKLAVAALMGYAVLQVATEDVESGFAINLIEHALKDRAHAAQWLAKQANPR